MPVVQQTSSSNNECLCSVPDRELSKQQLSARCTCLLYAPGSAAETADALFLDAPLLRQAAMLHGQCNCICLILNQLQAC